MATKNITLKQKTSTTDYDILYPQTTANLTSYSNSQTSSIITSNNVQGAIDQLFTSVSNGKNLIASTITDKGIPTEGSDSFATINTNISKLSNAIIGTAINYPLPPSATHSSRLLIPLDMKEIYLQRKHLFIFPLTNNTEFDKQITQTTIVAHFDPNKPQPYFEEYGQLSFSKVLEYSNNHFKYLGGGNCWFSNTYVDGKSEIDCYGGFELDLDWYYICF